MNILYLMFCCCCEASFAQPVITNSIGMEFIAVKPGSMTVGKYQPTVGKPPLPDQHHANEKMLPPAVYRLADSLARLDARPGFNVMLADGFYLGKFEVTQDQWQRVMHNNPSAFSSDSNRNHPVENVTWKDVQHFIRKLNKQDKQYRYRLPAEFEWEYAARAGAQDDIAWKEIRMVAVLSGKQTSETGTMKPNAWGFYDMLGNVWEWVSDYYNEKIFADPVPPGKAKQHVLKGASFTGDVKNATYMTHAAGPGNGFDVGFRLVLQIKPR